MKTAIASMVGVFLILGGGFVRGARQELHPKGEPVGNAALTGMEPRAWG